MMASSIPKSEHTSRPWRIHELTADFELEDVWELPAAGGADDFPRFLATLQSLDGENGGDSRISRFLFAARGKLGQVLGIDREGDGVGARVESLRDRLPDDLRNMPVDGLEPDGSPFSPLYVLDDEYAAEIANRTVHAVAHFGWTAGGDGGYRPRMAVLVKPNGLLGRAYMGIISPFRHLIVYPALIKTVDRAWRERAASGEPANA